MHIFVCMIVIIKHPPLWELGCGVVLNVLLVDGVNEASS